MCLFNIYSPVAYLLGFSFYLVSAVAATANPLTEPTLVGGTELLINSAVITKQAPTNVRYGTCRMISEVHSTIGLTNTY